LEARQQAWQPAQLQQAVMLWCATGAGLIVHQQRIQKP